MINLKTTSKRLDGWINLLTADHISRGRVWYPDARVLADELATGLVDEPTPF